MNWSSLLQRTQSSAWLESTFAARTAELNAAKPAAGGATSGDAVSTGFEWKARVKLGGIAIAAVVETVVYLVFNAIMFAASVLTLWSWKALNAKAADISDKKFATALAVVVGVIGFIKPEWAFNKWQAASRTADEQVGSMIVKVEGTKTKVEGENQGSLKKAALEKFQNLTKNKYEKFAKVEGQPNIITKAELDAQFGPERFARAIERSAQRAIVDYGSVQTLDKYAQAKKVSEQINFVTRESLMRVAGLKDFTTTTFDTWHYNLVTKKYSKEWTFNAIDRLAKEFRKVREEMDKTKTKEEVEAYRKAAKNYLNEFVHKLTAKQVELYGKSEKDILAKADTDKDGNALIVDGQPQKCHIEGQFTKYLDFLNQEIETGIRLGKNNFVEPVANDGKADAKGPELDSDGNLIGLKPSAVRKIGGTAWLVKAFSVFRLMGQNEETAAEEASV